MEKNVYCLKVLSRLNASLLWVHATIDKAQTQSPALRQALKQKITEINKEKQAYRRAL